MGVLLYRDAPQIERRPLEPPFAGSVPGKLQGDAAAVVAGGKHH